MTTTSRGCGAGYDCQLLHRICPLGRTSEPRPALPTAKRLAIAYVLFKLIAAVVALCFFRCYPYACPCLEHD